MRDGAVAKDQHYGMCVWRDNGEEDGLAAYLHCAMYRIEDGGAAGIPITNHHACFADYRKGTTNWERVKSDHT